MFFVCGFCRVRSCISQKGFFRYYFSLSAEAPADSEVFYLPYWRFKGVRYTCHFSGVESRFLDISALAMENYPSQLPFSLGFRSQALPLKLISNETQGKFIRPIQFRTAIKASDKRARSLGKDQSPVFQEDIGETTSLIYSPFYVHKNSLFDGVLNKVIRAEPTDIDMKPLNLCRPEKETVFVSGICPGCGSDLEGHFDSLVLVCRNCQTLWQSRGSRLGKIKYGCAKPAHPDDVMIPFWKMESDISPIPMNSYADLVRMGNLPRAVQPKWEDQPLHFWAPAFKIRPKIFLRLNTQLAIAQPDPLLEKKIRKNIHLPVNLPSSEAIQSIKITLASLMRPTKNHLPGLPGASIAPKNISLVFLPFERRLHEYFHQDLKVAINKNILALSGNL
ncbi:MAG: hypothetical protein GY860_07740 [Desulfobacteraceae bacterium]|nr:hypothetical protein [Desulfobacteraceae bacterium]